MQAWSDACALALFPSDGTRFYDWAFGYIFTAYMIEDVIVATKLDALMIWHHVGCLLGYYIAFSAIPSGYPYFFAGCIAFEVGSAAFNVYCLYPSRPMAAFFST
eukprot:CAMPEP_0206172068 /NCGR_PEP_ID=MMETSP1474-20131121/44527_1 /ASSEMBLY_ACC=CAM_ASM_001110 /TAXON_ID=97495 /ORGANISM="Imantonia sp., Strain RCC918" /LENGTH=103 /DNA_ID=CAMNT_0053579991 /DNA_START=81 /DNA_END=388 /DNA_ORIENTATION=-